MSLVFEWDPRKARANLLKHSVSFAEATSVFSDPLARIFEDEYHSADERREIILGDRKSTRLNSSHLGISYAVFCLKKKTHRCRRTGRCRAADNVKAISIRTEVD